jgi:WD40 repeat protein
MAEEILKLATPARVTSALIGQDGLIAAAVCADGKLRLWSREGSLTGTIDLGKHAIDVAEMSGDGKWIVTGDHAGGVTIWNASTGEAHMSMKMPPYAGVAAFSHDSGRLALAAQGRPVVVIDLATRRKVAELEEAVGGTTALAFSRDGAFLATAHGDTTVAVNEAKTGKRIATNEDFVAEALAIDFTADGKQVIAAGADKVVAYIDAATGKSVKRLDRTAHPVFRLAMSRDGAQFATAFIDADNMLLPAPVVVWDTTTGRKRSEWTPSGQPVGGAWTADGKFLVATAEDQMIRLWRVQ